MTPSWRVSVTSLFAACHQSFVAYVNGALCGRVRARAERAARTEGRRHNRRESPRAARSAASRNVEVGGRGGQGSERSEREGRIERAKPRLRPRTDDGGAVRCGGGRCEYRRLVERARPRRGRTPGRRFRISAFQEQPSRAERGGSTPRFVQGTGRPSRREGPAADFRGTGPEASGRGGPRADERDAGSTVVRGRIGVA